MKIFGKIIENIVLIVVFIVICHWAYQVVWAWERFWQGLVLMTCLTITYGPLVSHSEFLANKATFNLEKYSEKSFWFKFRTLLIYLSTFLGFFILVMGFYDNLVYTAPDSQVPVENISPLWSWMIFWFVFCFPIMYRGSKIDQEKEKEKEKIKEEKKKKQQAAKKKKQRAASALARQKRQQANEEREAALKVERQNAINQLEEKQANSEAKEKKLLKEMKKFESKIESEREIISALQKKYPFIEEIAPNRVK